LYYALGIDNTTILITFSWLNMRCF
jgi:hypothetical protein